MKENKEKSTGCKLPRTFTRENISPSHPESGKISRFLSQIAYSKES